MKRKVLASVLAAVVLGTGLGYQAVADAHPNEKKAPTASEQRRPEGERGPRMSREGRPGNGRPGMGMMRRQRPTKEQMVAAASERYGYDKAELMGIVDAGLQPMDLNLVCNLAKMSGEPLAKVAELRKTMTHGRIEFALGLTPEVIAKKQLEQQAKELVNDNVVSRPVAEKLLAKGYNSGEIKHANALALHANKKLEAVLKLKTADNSWAEVAKKIGVSEADAKAVAEKNREIRVRKSGPGFSGIHYRKVDTELVSSVFNDNYKFDKKEIGKYFDAGMSMGDLDITCLYAYLAKQPLSKVMAMRKKMTMGQIKVALGLTPQKYYEAVVDYQARRLKERMDMPEELTRSYLMKGYSMHHLNVAFLMAPMCGKDIDTIIAHKTPAKRWNAVAEELGLTQEQFKQVTGKIYYEFQHKYDR